MSGIRNIPKIAKLARIKLADAAETLKFEGQINTIMSMIDELQAVECDNVEPLRSVIEGLQHNREDKVTEKNITADLFSNAPGPQSQLAKDVKFFVVPKVVE